MTQFFASKLVATIGGSRFAALAAYATLVFLGQGQSAEVKAQGGTVTI